MRCIVKILSFHLFSALGLSGAAYADFNQASLKTEVIKFERHTPGRLGIVAIDTADNAVFAYRGDEKFPMCSTSKFMAVAAILKKSESLNDLMNQKIAIKKADLVNYNPVTEKHIGSTMTISELSAAALQYSDNTAMNLLVKYLGGPDAVTRFARSTGDKYFRLDRKEPELNSAIPGDSRDTSTPESMAKSLYQLVLGKVLAEPQRKQLADWLKGNTTGADSIRAGVPSGWIVGDKTGSGQYGTTNDIAVIWPQHRAPIILVTYFTQRVEKAPPRKDVLAKAAKLVVSNLQD